MNKILFSILLIVAVVIGIYLWNNIEPKPRVFSPQNNTVVTSPLEVTGEAPGPWFFEANLPIRLADSAGTIIAETGAQAQGEWMTIDYVKFRGVLTFAKPKTSTGFLIIANDNPSGLPENQKEFRLPIAFE